MLQYGGTAEEALLRREANKHQPSNTLDQKPELTLSQAYIWRVYILLNSSRLEGFGGPQRIQVSEMLACVSMTLEAADDLVEILSSLDDFYFEWRKLNGQ